MTVGSLSPRTVLTSLKVWVVLFRILLHLVRLVWVRTGSVSKTVKFLQYLFHTHDSLHGPQARHRFAQVNGRYFLGLHIPGWPSPQFDRWVLHELGHASSPTHNGSLVTAIVAITRRCHLQCEHCLEWDRLGETETVSVEMLENTIAQLQKRGVGTIQLSGGEPLERFYDLLTILMSAQPTCDFWILTSGVGLTATRAGMLADAGLTGVNVSLDHWQPARHNHFRGMTRAFEWAEKAVVHAKKAGLVTCLSICATRDFVSRDNLVSYHTLAKEWGVAFIQLLEPRSVGRYAGNDVALTPENVADLEVFFLECSTGGLAPGAPQVIYHGYHQRRMGCVAAGFRYLYIDSNGAVHACPFCQDPVGSIHETSLDGLLVCLQEKSCQEFTSAAPPHYAGLL
ncbi:MAG: radical SAM protein [Fidelibacterota bacterium]|nr:MAG: radical SAM protein [Candidatus Neomarinimicrobiota bacterium]